MTALSESEPTTADAGDAFDETLSPRSHKARRQKARQRILEAAYRIVANGGFDDLTLAGVGEAAGYSRALPAHYFGSKEELIAALADAIIASHETYISHMSTGEGGLPTLLASARRMLDQPLEEPEAIRAFHAFLGAALSKSALAGVARQVNADTMERLLNLLRQAQSRGQIRKEIDVGIEAQAIFGSLRGIVALWLADPADFPLAAVRDAYLAQLKRSLAA